MGLLDMLTLVFWKRFSFPLQRDLRVMPCVTEPRFAWISAVRAEFLTLLQIKVCGIPLLVLPGNNLKRL